MTRYDIQSLIMASATASISGVLSSDLSGRVIKEIARLDIAEVDAESAEEIYDCICAAIEKHARSVNVIDRRAWVAIADRLAIHVQRLNSPTGRRIRNVVR